MDKNELDSLLNTLGFIAFYKGMLPFRLRGWASVLGLHVQERRAGSWTRLQAGGKFRSYLDAWQQGQEDWEVKKFDHETWQQRFAHVVSPTLNIADYLRSCTVASQMLSNEQDIILQVAIQHYKSTRLWRWLPRVTMASEEVSEQMAQLEPPILDQEISYAERIRTTSGDVGDWDFLALLYDLGGRYKDMENALKMAYKLISAENVTNSPNYWRWQKKLGMLYFAAYSNSIHGQSTVILGSNPSKITAESLGYSIQEVRALAKENLNKVSTDIINSVYKPDSHELHQLELAIADLG